MYLRSKQAVRSEQNEAPADFATGAYIDVRDLAKTQRQQSYATLIIRFREQKKRHREMPLFFQQPCFRPKCFFTRYTGGASGDLMRLSVRQASFAASSSVTAFLSASSGEAPQMNAP